MMKTTIAILLVLAVCMTTLAQIKYEPGYIISNDGTRTDCEIRNVDWSSNPTSFQYRIGTGQPQEGNLETVSEFGVTGGSTYRRFAVDIDRSSDTPSKLNNDRNPTFKKETLFLRILVNGKALLYEYVDAGLKRYFYSVDAGAPAQLVYKVYLQMNAAGTFETGYSTANEQYKQQIFLDLKCASISQKDVENLKYERGPLMRLFNKYNECTGTAVSTGVEEKPKSIVRLSLRPGVFYNGFYIQDASTRRDFEKAAAFRIGLEVEAVLPFNKGLWAVTFEPVYQTYSSKVSGTSTSIDYSALDLSLSLRRYLFVKEKESLYVSLGLAYPIDLSGFILVGNAQFVISSGPNLLAGLGYKMGKFSAEFNYAFNRGLLSDYVNFNSGYGGPGLIVGYQFR